MIVKCHVLKEDVTVTLTPEEVWDLIIICEGSKLLYRQYTRECKKNSMLWEDYKALKEMAETMQQKFIAIRNTGPIEEVEI